MGDRSVGGCSAIGSSVSGIVSRGVGSVRLSTRGSPAAPEGVRLDGTTEVEAGDAARKGETGAMPVWAGLAAGGLCAGWERGVGAVTPGITSMGRTCPGAGAAGPASDRGRAGGCWPAPGRGRGVLVLGCSKTGGSSGGGSWARAKPAQPRTTHSDRTVTRLDIGHSSRYESRRAGIDTPQQVPSVRATARHPFFSQGSRNPDRLERAPCSARTVCKSD